MNDDEAEAKLKSLIHGDPECDHHQGDRLLCDLLRETHPKTVAVFEEMEKWYA